MDMTSILDHPLISARYFFPRRETPRDGFPVDCGDVRLECYYRVVRPGAKTIVHFHGNGEVVADYVGPFAGALADRGINSFFVEYRGYGGSTGEPALGAMLDDVSPVIRSLGLPPEELVLFGRSVGSIYAIHATLHFPDAAGLIIESGIADPLERLLLRVSPEELGVTVEELGAEVDQRMNHRALVARFTRPALFLHTRHDGLVGLDNAERLLEWAGGAKSLVVFETGDHSSILACNFELYMSKVEEFVDSLP
jgi:pimeloyl-ACP methyl ester carboxylesterase